MKEIQLAGLILFHLSLAQKDSR